MYQDLKGLFWYPGMKEDVAKFVHSCLTCQKSKIEHQKSLCLMQPLNIPKWKCDNISVKFVRLCGISSSIMPNRDPRFTSRF